jgi:hypothetical protein
MGFFRDLFGPRQPCALCHLGQASWPSDRSGTADWKIRGEGLHVALLVCVPCRTFLIESGLLQHNPMVALASLVSKRAALRPELDAYLQHPDWRKIWMHILERGGLRPTDEFAALQMMRPLEEEFMKRAGVGGSPGHDARDHPDTLDVGPSLKAMMAEYGIPDEVVERKYMSYAMALRMSGQDANWNDDIDDHGRSIGALSQAEIEAARRDIHQAILNRIKVALVTEGWSPVDPTS